MEGSIKHQSILEIWTLLLYIDPLFLKTFLSFWLNQVMLISCKDTTNKISHCHNDLKKCIKIKRIPPTQSFILYSLFHFFCWVHFLFPRICFSSLVIIFHFFFYLFCCCCCCCCLLCLLGVTKFILQQINVSLPW